LHIYRLAAAIKRSEIANPPAANKRMPNNENISRSHDLRHSANFLC